jgi:hypothetical protein
VNELVRFALVAFFPREGDLPGLSELGVDGKVAALRRDATLLFWTGVVAAAVFFQISPILTVRRPFPAVLLTDDQLDEHAHRLATHPVYAIRQIVVMLKLMAGIFWAQSPEIRAFLHLPAYGEDPGTRRVGPFVARPPAAPPRAPVPALVELGRRETARGRSTMGAPPAPQTPPAPPPSPRRAPGSRSGDEGA